VRKINTQAVVLKSINYRDADRIYTLLTQHRGKITAVARGVRKITSRRSGNLDSFNLVDLKISFSEKRFNNIEEVVLINSFKKIKSSKRKTILAFYFAELIHKSVEEDASVEEIFQLLSKTYKLLDKSNKSFEFLTAFFEIRLLKYLGYLPSYKDLEDSFGVGILAKKIFSGDTKGLSNEKVNRVRTVLDSFIKRNISDEFKSLKL